MPNKWNPDDFEKAFGRSGQSHSDKENKEKSSSGDKGKKDGAYSWHFTFPGKDSQTKEPEQEPQSGRPRGKEVKSDKAKKWSSKKLTTLVVVVLLALILLSGFYVLPEGQIAYVTQFGKIVTSTEEAGLHFHLPLVQHASFLNKKIMIYNVNPSEVLTADKKAMVVDSYALWKIDDAQLFMRTLSGNVSEMEKRIDASVYSNIKNIVGGLMQSDIISDEESSRNSLNERVTAYAGAELANYGVEVLRVEIRRYDLPSDNLSAVYSRMISERKQMAEALRAEGEYDAAKLRNETDKECEIIVAEAKAQSRKLEGEAEAEYMEILKQLYSSKDSTDFYCFMLELDALKASLQGDKTLILGQDSFIGQLLQSQQKEQD